jgi:hypothetical protein
MKAEAGAGVKRRLLVALLLLLAALGAGLWLALSDKPQAAPQTSDDASNATTARAEPLSSSVTVRVLADGKPLADVGVLLQHVAHTELFFTERSDQRGEAHFPLIPKGAYALTTMRLGYQAPSRNIGVTSEKHLWTVVLKPAADQDAEDAANDSAEQEPQAGGSIKGTVVNTNGVPIENAQVGASGSGAPRFTTTDAQGRFALVDLTGTRVNLFMTHASYAASHLHDVAVGSSQIRLVASQAAEITGTLEFETAPEQLFVRLCRFETAFDKEVCVKSEYSKPPQARYHLKRVPVGEFSLVFWDGKRQLLRVPLKVEPGQHIEVPVQRL